jgi:hypothetical protein
MIDLEVYNKQAERARDGSEPAMSYIIMEADNVSQEINILRETLLEMVCQACYTHGSSDLDSMALTSYAGAMRLLAERGMLVIDSEHGRRVIAHISG